MARIVVYGPPLTGKTTMMKAYANHHGLPIRRLSGDATYGFAAWRGVRIPLDDGEIVTICGAVWTPTMWDDLLKDATHVLVAVDGQAAREAATKESIERLASYLAPGSPYRAARVMTGCVVRTKNDLLARYVSEPIDMSFLARTNLAAWPLFEARHDRPETLWSPLDWLVAQSSQP